MPTKLGMRSRNCLAKLVFKVYCTYFGAEFLYKKTLNLPQNLENKGREFFLPARSMVLKVVTGKIFKTLELRYSPSWALEQQAKLGEKAFALTKIGRDSAVGGQEAACVSGCQRT